MTYTPFEKMLIVIACLTPGLALLIWASRL